MEAAAAEVPALEHTVPQVLQEALVQEEHLLHMERKVVDGIILIPLLQEVEMTADAAEQVDVVVTVVQLKLLPL